METRLLCRYLWVAVAMALPAGGWAETIDSARLDAAPVKSVGLFKNGFAFVSRTVTPSNGVALVRADGRPAYGTFWHSSPDRLTITAKKGDLLRPANANDGSQGWSKAYDGREVSVSFRAAPPIDQMLSAAEKEGGMRISVYSAGDKDMLFTVAGRMLAPGESNRTADPYSSYWYAQRYAQNYDTSNLTLVLGSGSLLALPENQVVAVKAADGKVGGVDCNVDIWYFEGAAKPFTIQYLTAGAAWAPSYRLQLGKTDADLLMSAEIRNDLADFTDVDVQLISGFPSVKYSTVDSLLASGMDLNKFYEQITAAESGNVERRRSAGMMTQMMIGERRKAPVGFDSSNAAAYATLGSGAGADVHYRPVGKISLKKGETIVLPLGAGKTGYRRIVDWHIPANRDANGHGAQPKEMELWDAVEFKNPFAFPLTTAAIEVTEEGRIVGQSQATWTNPGDETQVKITKALSVKGIYTEEGSGLGKLNKHIEHQIFYCWEWYKETVTGKMTVRNFRSEPVLLRVGKRLFGEVSETSVDPAKSICFPAQDFCPNTERELTWEFELQPGESRDVALVYSLWVRR